MLSAIWRWFRNGEAQRRKDEAATERFLREHEEAEREKHRPPELPPGRSNTDWTYVGPP